VYLLLLLIQSRPVSHEDEIDVRDRIRIYDTVKYVQQHIWRTSGRQITVPISWIQG